MLLDFRKRKIPERWITECDLYHLQKTDILDDLSERLVVEWGGGAINWAVRKDKEVVEIKGKKSIGDFQSFSEVDLAFQDLKMLMRSPETNVTWVKALSSVNGVYLIQDKLSGKLYVGSAYGDEGIYGRWSTYAKNWSRQ